MSDGYEEPKADKGEFVIVWGALVAALAIFAGTAGLLVYFLRWCDPSYVF